MTQLSRKQKYQELRDRLDEETTAAQAQPVKLQRRSRTDNLSHANKPLYPHDTVRTQPVVKEMPTSPVMENLLGEVKQYNIDNGHRIADDTQINILKQLDSSEPRPKRNNHFIAMDIDDELGSTMKINTAIKEDDVLTSLPDQKLTRINPVATKVEEPEEVKEEPKIVLSSDDIVADDVVENDELDLMDMSHDDFDKTAKRPKNKKKKEKRKSNRDDLENMPSAKLRMKTSDFEDTSKKKKKNGTETVLNVILVILILALLGVIGYAVYIFKSSGIF